MSALSVRRPLALLAVLGMVAALLFAVVGTASAADGPDSAALFSACPDNANVPDSGFTDTAGLTAEANIDCIAYYEVTTGTSPTTYSPKDNVLRWQMALFLTRMATSAGVVLNPTPPDAGFTDIGHLPAARQLAINQLADAGIVYGTSPTTYSPNAPVIRQHMALFLTRFADAAVEGPGGTLPKNIAVTPTTPFTDIGAVSHEEHKAIGQLWDLVITTGTSPTTYSPNNLVKRDQMASFLARTMNHMNSRPAGVNIQANPMVIEGAIDPAGEPAPDGWGSVTVRNADFSAAPNVHVDAFAFYADKATDKPFDTDGACDTDLYPVFLDVLDPPGYDAFTDICKVSINDGVSNANGNIVDEGDAAIPFFDITDAFTTFYAWTGATGAMFDADTTTYSSVVIEGVPGPPARDYAVLSVDVDPDFDVPFGTAVTWTVQLMGTDDKPLAKAGVDVKFADFWEDYEEADIGDIVKTVATDSSGKATYSVTEEMIDKAHEAWHNVSATIPGPPVVPVEDEYTNPDPSFQIWWSAVDPYAAWVALSTPTDYKVIAAAPATTPNSVTATVLDQYGDLYTGPGQVKFWSDVSEGLGGSQAAPALTLPLVGGYATANYVWEAGADSDYEVLFADVVSGGREVEGDMSFWWVDEGVAGNVYEGPSPLGDVDVNEMIIASGGIDFGPFDVSEYGMFLLTWKADDRYLVEDVSSTMAEFESFLDEAWLPLVIVDKYLDPADDGKTSWNVEDIGGP